MKICFIRYVDPSPFPPDNRDPFAEHYRAIFAVAGIVLREDEDFLLIGEKASAEDNPKLASRFGQDMFPAYRNIIAVRKKDIISRQDFETPEQDTWPKT
ncbi:MAG: hypothetical protein QXP70_03155 [Methanomassiliicoccales archaeon]